MLSFSSCGRLRACGTFPCTAATTAVGPPDAGSTGSAAPAAASPAAAATARAGPASRRESPGRPRDTRISQASVPPARATRNVSSGAPPTAAQPAVGAEAWLIASLPHGKPPHGQRSRSASAATHQPATATGQPGSRSSNRWPTASTPKMTASPPASPTHAYHATFSTQESIRKKNATPKTSPTTNEPRRVRPASATVSSAGPTAASGQIPRRREGHGQGQPAAQRDQQGPAQGQPAVRVSGPPAQAGRGGRLGGDHPSERSSPQIRSAPRAPPRAHAPATTMAPTSTLWRRRWSHRGAHADG